MNRGASWDTIRSSSEHSGCFVNSLFDVAENKKKPNKQLRFLTTISSDVSRKIARNIMEIVEGRGE